MQFSQKVLAISESITLKLNEKAVALSEQGENVYNLTAGQLPFKPDQMFIDYMENELIHLKSFQYSPVSGFNKLREQIIEHVERTRSIKLSQTDAIVSNGGKHSLFTLLSTILDVEDEVVLLSPYWLSYPEMVSLLGAKNVIVEGKRENGFAAELSEIEKCITDKTKAIIINSPSNPAGVFYSPEWMKGFAELAKKYPNVWLISDEIYFHLAYGAEKPTYFYQFAPELLSRTAILDGLSKALSCTGLRIGYCVGPKELIGRMSKFQAHTASGANSLVQKAMMKYPLEQVDRFLEPVLLHLSENVQILHDKFKEYGLEELSYECNSAFYYLIDLTKTTYFKNNFNEQRDFSSQIAEAMLDKIRVAVVPTSSFGAPNAVRISLVLPVPEFTAAVERLCKFLSEMK